MPSVLITGSTAGPGRDVALELATAGWTVVVHGRSRERGATVLREVRAAGSPDARLEVGDPRALAEAVGPVDVLCNHAPDYLLAFVLARRMTVRERIVNVVAGPALDVPAPMVMFTFSLAERLDGTTV